MALYSGPGTKQPGNAIMEAPGAQETQPSSEMPRVRLSGRLKPILPFFNRRYRRSQRPRNRKTMRSSDPPWKMARSALPALCMYRWPTLYKRPLQGEKASHAQMPHSSQSLAQIPWPKVRPPLSSHSSVLTPPDQLPVAA